MASSSMREFILFFSRLKPEPAALLLYLRILIALCFSSIAKIYF